MDITILILTLNEELHIKRCIESCLKLNCSILVVDSYSNDKTCLIAENLGASVLYREFDCHYNQVNWALKKLKGKCKWVFRIDADEIISNNLKSEIISKISKLSDEIEGVYINRNIIFLGKLIRFGGCFNRRTLRIVRPEKAICEERLMDEHLLVNGKTTFFESSIYDFSLKSLTFWIEKHNCYASKEAAEMLKLNYLRRKDNIRSIIKKVPLVVFLKNRIYSYLPLFSRPFLYFIYRYIIKLGFLDGERGFIFHFMQSYWYRNLVDSKIYEVLLYSKLENKSLVDSTKKILDIDIKHI